MLGLLCEPDNASLTKKMSEIDDALKDDGVAISEELQQELQSLSSEDYLGRALECRNEVFNLFIFLECILTRFYFRGNIEKLLMRSTKVFGSTLRIPF